MNLRDVKEKKCTPLKSGFLTSRGKKILTDNDKMYFLTRSTFYYHYQNTLYSCFIVADKEYIQDTEHMFVT